MSCSEFGKHRLCANRDKSGAEIQGGKHLPTGVQLATNHYQNSNAWLEGTCTFVAEPLAAAFRVYAGQTAGTGGGYVDPSKGEHGPLAVDAPRWPSVHADGSVSQPPLASRGGWTTSRSWRWTSPSRTTSTPRSRTSQDSDTFSICRAVRLANPNSIATAGVAAGRRGAQRQLRLQGRHGLHGGAGNRKRLGDGPAGRGKNRDSLNCNSS